MFQYFRKVAGRERSERYDEHLAQFLTFIAGAANAGGYMAIRQYTSHMTGIASAAADALALGNLLKVEAAFAAIFSFVAGAGTSAILINWGRRKGMHSQFALPLLLEASLLAGFGVLGEWLQSYQGFIVPLTVMLLCFIMGLQNAMITKLSGARIRTTHITGMVTDIGIELGKFFYINRNTALSERVIADWPKMRLLAMLIFLFFAGGVLGAIGFNYSGFIATLFLAVLLMVLAVIPVIDDLMAVPAATDRAPENKSR